MSLMNLQINGTNVTFEFPLQVANTESNKDVLIQPINEKYQYKIEASYIVKAAPASQSQQ
jgi:hypothetical protein